MWREAAAAYLKEFPPVPPTKAKGAKPLSKCGGHNKRECQQCQDRDKPPPVFSGPVLGFTPFSPAHMIRSRDDEKEPEWTEGRLPTVPPFAFRPSLKLQWRRRGCGTL